MFALWPGDLLNFSIFKSTTFGFPAKRGAGSGQPAAFGSALLQKHKHYSAYLMRVFPNVFLIVWIIILIILVLGLFAGSVYVSIVITTDDNATAFLKYAVYLFTIILGTTLYVLKRSFRGKFYFIKKLTTGEFKIYEPWTMTTEILDKKVIKGYSKSSNNSRRFVRLYFETRDDITFLTYYGDYGQLESKLHTEGIKYLGQEKYENNFCGRPTGQKF